jgi:phage terminase small subunit
MAKAKKLSHMQKMFVKHLLADPAMNGTQAAIKAGYSEKTANEQSTRLLANVHIKKLIDDEKAKREEKVGYDAEKLLTDLVSMLEINVIDALPVEFSLEELKKLPPEVKNCISSIDLKNGKIKIFDRLALLETIGKHINVSAFRENISLTVAEGLGERLDAAKEKARARREKGTT